MDWFPAVMTLVGVLVGVGVQELRFWHERKDKYKDMIFEKRLDAHQGAYYRCMKLTEAVRADRLMTDEGVEAAIKESWTGMDWLHKNALYLDENLRFKMNNFILYIASMGLKYRDKKWRKNIDIEKEVQNVTKRVMEVLNSIRIGIGVKYLPEGEIGVVGSESIEMRKIYEEFLEAMVKDAKRLGSEKDG